MPLTSQPGASYLEILNEPDWTRTHSHRVGTRDRDARYIGLTHGGDEIPYDLEEVAEEKLNELRQKVERGELVTVRDIMTKQIDFHLRRPDVHPKFWRYVLHTTESFIKQEQPWPVNVAKRGGEEKRRAKEEIEDPGRGKKGDSEEQSKGQEEDAQKDVKPKMSFEEAALLKYLQHEQKYRSSMRQNDGRGRSPFHDEVLPEQIDEADQFSPDSWVPRSKSLKRLTGKHPMNAEADLTTLFDAGLITPSPIHYVRNHGAVPHLLWENHKLDVVVDRPLTFGMDELISRFNSINIPIFLACDGSRRKELNMIKRTRGCPPSRCASRSGCCRAHGERIREVLLGPL
ncbi:sulfite oxidase, molybdopterin-binding component [Aspergillus oryzae 100-8]|uniref:Sulfite oxidase, molybdopterin-binding component n=1 Tax=Aspergillus oryzae (strain 3.042) TaxID=1160506 RepID=I8A9Q0_ASPO3|nr:sulfite oxidase, molybdopterin-binding component [Aspergillus oryzae 3.042]KDE85212.1 sulfite oxidase, molybdopterin-binding component [Aspergillus oryzae 100-8]|eukprot:EIT81664.1 sulfite oxidase, molybdopterin-binding component [Aspergillus oryzae 3.042]